MSELKSRCCKAEVEAIHEDEGTSYYSCKKCFKPCDISKYRYIRDGEKLCPNCKKRYTKNELCFKCMMKSPDPYAHIVNSKTKYAKRK